MYTTRRPDELAELLGLSVKQEKLIPPTSFPEDIWVGDQAVALEVEEVLENVLESESTEDGPSSDMETPGGDKEENSSNGSQPDCKKKSKDHEYKTKPSSELNVKEIHSTDFFDAFLYDGGEEKRGLKSETQVKKTPKEYRTEAPKRKAEGAPLTNSEKKMFKEAFNTDKARLAKRQVKFNRAANFLILVEDNIHEGTAALTAGKIMAFGMGPLKERFLSEGVRFNAEDFYMHAKTHDFTREIVHSDDSEEE